MWNITNLQKETGDYLVAISKYLENRKFQVALVILLAATILAAYQFGPFLAYGVPGVTIRKIVQTEPTSKTATIQNTYGEWISLEYYKEAYGEWKNWLQQRRYARMSLSVTLKIKMEVTDLASPQFLTEVKPPPFLLNETQTQYIYQNMTVQAYMYGFKITTLWTGSVQVGIVESHEDSFIIGGPSLADIEKQVLRDTLIPDFNNDYLTTAKILYSIDAPTLGRDQAYTLRPDFLGMAGMWLTDYKIKGSTTGTAVELTPQGTGTSIKLFRDESLTSPCWGSPYTANLGEPKLTPDVVYWLDHFAPQSAYFSTTISKLGSQLAFDDSKGSPNWISWAWEKWSDSAPAAAQWVRVDLLFKTTQGWTVPKIPEYELPPEELEKQHIIITVEPENQGTEQTQPSLPQGADWITLILYTIIAIVALLLIITVAYYLIKRYRRK